MSAGGQGDAGAKALGNAEDGVSVHFVADGERVQIVNASGERCADGVARVVGVAGERVEQDAGSARAFELCGPWRERLGCAGELGFFGPGNGRVRSFDYGHDVASRELNVVAQGYEGGATPSYPAFSPRGSCKIHLENFPYRTGKTLAHQAQIKGLFKPLRKLFLAMRDACLKTKMCMSSAVHLDIEGGAQ